MVIINVQLIFLHFISPQQILQCAKFKSVFCHEFISSISSYNDAIGHELYDGAAPRSLKTVIFASHLQPSHTYSNGRE